MYDITLPKSSFFIKFIECFLFAFAIINVYNSLVVFPIASNAEEYKQTLNYLRLFDVALVIGCVLFALAYPIVWHVKENKGKIKSTSRHAFFLASIRLWLTVMICTYAFAKILGTQFAKDLVRDNTLTKNLSGFDLTWFYFSYSYPFAVTIAIFQLTGAILLLFRKTVFLGVCILLPVMLNIVLINLFYNIANAAEMNAVFYTIALLFLLSLFWREIKNVLVATSKTLSRLEVRNFAKYIFRFIAVAYTFTIVYYLSITKSPTFLVGKWNVETLIKGTETINSNAWLTDSTAWKNVYLDGFGDITVNPNPYVIETKRAQKGQFHYDVKSRILSLLLGSQNNLKDSFEFQVTETDEKHMRWVGQHQGQSLQINLLKSD
jgi:hypothetical protein